MRTRRSSTLLCFASMLFPTLLLSCALPSHSHPIAQSTAAETPATPAIAWQPWSDAVFAQAKAEHKYVLLDLEAVWCHWCHVQDEVTYRDPKVIALLNSKYVTVKVDQDSRPDISNRYEDYGWPATIVFNADRGEIVKRSGYLPPRQMSSILQAIIDDPTPGPSVGQAEHITYSDSTALAGDLRKQLEAKVLEFYDTELGGWGKIHKYVDWDKMEYEMSRFRAGDQAAGERAKKTLTAGLKLIDPVWGGVYQYSIEGDWDHPHFEKLVQFQGEQMRIYSLAYLTFHDRLYLKAATDIHRYVGQFLRCRDGAYWVSQDADVVDGTYAEDYFKLDDAGRRKQGIPRVDTNLYARENGWAISGLVSLYEAGGDATALTDAQTAADWVVTHRALPGGGFSHAENDKAGPYLGDTLFMGQAFLRLYEATADRQWLTRASGAADFIASHFELGLSAGFATAAGSEGSGFVPQPEVAENVVAARFFNLMAAYTGSAEHRQLAQHAMKFVATQQIAASPDAPVAAILLADHESATPPLHITVVGSKRSDDARSLFIEALRAPAWYKRMEWWDPGEGALPNPDVDYPQLKSPAAFLCTGNACSSPVKTPAALAATVAKAD